MIEWLMGAVLLSVLLPLVAYNVARAARLGWDRGGEVFKRHQHQKEATYGYEKAARGS